MNRSYSFIAACFLSALSFAQNDSVLLRDRRPAQNPTYCAVLKDGVTVVMSEDKPILNDIVLSNGMRISPDGAIVKKDGNRMELKSGECIAPTGEILSPSQADAIKRKKK